MSKKALLVVDVQKYYLNEHTDYLPYAIEHYIKSNHYDFVIFSKFINHTRANIFKTFNWGKMMTPNDTDICDNLLQFITEDNLFIKDTYSVFKAKGFHDYLLKNEIHDLTLCGLDADACILASAYDGFDLGYSIHVLDDLTDCHIGDEFKQFGLNIINKNIQVRTNAVK